MTDAPDMRAAAEAALASGEWFQGYVSGQCHKAHYPHPGPPDCVFDRTEHRLPEALSIASTDGTTIVAENVTPSIEQIAHIVASQPRAVLALLDAHAAEIERLERLVYVPGLWRCAKCDFRLVQANLNVPSGTVTARDEPGDKCPNCGGPLWRVTERDAANDMVDRCEASEAELREARAEALVLRPVLDLSQKWLALNSRCPDWCDAHKGKDCSCGREELHSVMCHARGAISKKGHDDER